MTKALVIGGNGFIGSHLVDKLVENGWEVIVLDLFDRRYDTCPPQVRFIRGDLDQHQRRPGSSISPKRRFDGN